MIVKKIIDKAMEKADSAQATMVTQETSAVGWEVDLAARTTRIAGMKVDGGLAFFVPDDSFAGFADTKTGLWGYVMLTGNFGGKM